MAVCIPNFNCQQTTRFWVCSLRAHQWMSSAHIFSKGTWPGSNHSGSISSVRTGWPSNADTRNTAQWLQTAWHAVPGVGTCRLGLEMLDALNTVARGHGRKPDLAQMQAGALQL